MIDSKDNEFRQTLKDAASKRKECFENAPLVNALDELNRRTAQKLTHTMSVEHGVNYLLERTVFYNSEFCQVRSDETPLGRNRILSVNPGANNIGREQRYIHYYIVLAEYKDMFIGVPITNKAYNTERASFYLRNPYEVELINPCDDIRKKPFNHFWVTKPSVVDLRNITGMDKRRIIRDALFLQPKYAPAEYMTAVKYKLRDLLHLMDEADV